MSLGICTRYRHCEATAAALRFAGWSREEGRPVSIFPTTTTRVAVDPQWDAAVNKTRRTCFTDWAKQHTTIIWTHCPIPEQVEWARKRGIRTSILCLWSEVQADHADAYHAADFVFAPSQSVLALAKRILRLDHVVGLPWDTGEPFTVKDPRIQPRDVWVLMPLFDYEPYQIEATAIEVAGRALQRVPNMRLTVAYNTSKIAPFAVQRFKQFQQYFGDRVCMRPSVPLNRRALLYASHDLTYWPACGGDLGTVGIASITLGTPVLGFQVPAFAEFLDDTNSIQVAATSYGDAQGTPLVEPDYEAMDTMLSIVAEEPDEVRAMQQHVLTAVVPRRKIFETILTQTIK